MMRILVEFYADKTQKNQKAIVHCRMGHGRTGTTLTILARLLQQLDGTNNQITQAETL